MATKKRVRRERLPAKEELLPKKEARRRRKEAWRRYAMGKSKSGLKGLGSLRAKHLTHAATLARKIDADSAFGVAITCASGLQLVRDAAALREHARAAGRAGKPYIKAAKQADKKGSGLVKRRCGCSR